jgi:hypothetical protein
LGLYERKCREKGSPLTPTFSLAKVHLKKRGKNPLGMNDVFKEENYSER